MASDLSRALQHLHALLRQLGDAEKALTMGPRRVAAAEKAVQAAKDAIEAQKLEIKNRRKQADEFNLKLKTKEADLLKLQGVLNQASSNKEYDILRGQIKTGAEDRTTMEDSALTAMDAVDAASRVLKERETDLKAREQQLRTAQEEFKAAEDGLRITVAETQTLVAAAEKVIPGGEALSTYKRLRLAHGAEALAAVEDSFCTACNNKITTQDIVRLNTGNVLICRECGRLVYVVE